MHQVTLEEMLAAREHRVWRQTELLARYHRPLVSFSMNIPGPVKDTPLIRRSFFAGCESLRAALAAGKLPLLFQESNCSVTGCEGFFVADTTKEKLKELCIAIEDEGTLGRLFDMDVIGIDGQKVDRSPEQAAARNCIVCGAAGRGCASRRLHSVTELQQATRRIMADHFREADRRLAGRIATKALLDEVCTTPKPGLVDSENNGSHQDMDIFTFMTSAAALAPYWEECFRIGQDSADRPPEETFRKLRMAGLAAERVMFTATRGVNTHKGAIFLLGTVCGAAGRLWQPDRPETDAGKIAAECSAMTKQAMTRELNHIWETTEEGTSTNGQRVCREYHLPGVRGEIASGLPSVLQVSLPLFRLALQKGLDRNDAGVAALIHLIALGNDTNLMARGGFEAAAKAVDAARQLIDQEIIPSLQDIRALDATYIRENLSPGGCADLLAVTYFLADLEDSLSNNVP